MVASWTTTVAAPAVVAAVVSVAASGVAGILRRREEQRAWFRALRHEKYAALITAGRRLATVMRWAEPYDQYPEALERAYDEWFEISSTAQFLAGPQLQEAIQRAR